MADTASNDLFRLPEDLDSLARMRDQLSDYLNTLERNTDSVNAWLQKSQNGIIVGHHQLNRAVAQKNEKAALQAIQELGDAAGFVLSMQDFKGQVATAFGAESAVAKEVAKHEAGVPKAILEVLPDITMPDPNAPSPVIHAPPAPIAPAPEPEKKRSIWNPGTWFGKDERAEEEARRDAAAEAERKIEEIKRHWRLVRSELISLQSDRHYYIDSFMDWVGETLAPQQSDENEARKLMEKYQNPQFVIDLAVKDYAEVMEVKVGQLRDRALRYSETAALIDEQRIGEFATTLKTLFPKNETTDSKQIKDLLLQDYKVVSFAEMALDRVQSRGDQLLLLKTALELEPQFKLSGLSSKAQIFERILKETTAANDPLDSSALQLTLKKLEADKDPAGVIDLSSQKKTVFERLAQRFNTTLSTMQAAAAHVLIGLGNPGTGTEAQIANFVKAVREKDPLKLGTALSRIEPGASALAFKGLWNLTYPGISLMDEIAKTAKNTSDLSALTEIALRVGVADEFKIGTNAVQGDAKNVLKFVNEKIMPDHEDFSLAVMRKLIGLSFANAGLDLLRKELTRSGGWLEQAVSSPLNAEGRLSWVAALVEPWTSNIVKSNILFEAAQNAKSPEAKKALLSLEENLTGENLRLDDGRILTNIDRIANIWYDGDTKVMRLTVNGTGHTMLDDVSPQMAKEVLTHLQRKAPFLQPEYDGLYNPKNIDRIVTTPQKTAIYWGNHSGMLNVPDETIAALHKHPDFMHVTQPQNGQTHSINLKTIALVQPLQDGTHLLVDKYGAVQVLEGKVEIAGKDNLLDLSGTFFNPRNASILSLDPAKGTVGFRAESKDFEDLLESVSPGQYFYTLEMNAADFKRAQAAVAAAPAIAAPNAGDLKNMYFNFEALGYMIYTDEREPGFSIRKNGPAKTPGFIATQEEQLAKNIYAGLAANPNLVSVGNVITHRDMIDDAYFNADKQRFYLVLNNDILPVPAEDKEAYAVLEKLSKESGFMVVGASPVPAPSGHGTVDAPADVINLNRAVMQFYSEAQDKTFLVADNERFYYIGYDREQASSLFDLLEKKGLEGAKDGTPKALAWTQKLRETAESLPVIALRMTPSLTDLSRENLLDQALGKTGENRAMPEPKKDFAIAAAPFKANSVLEYPRRANVAPGAKTQPRR